MVMAVMVYNNDASVHCSDVHEMGLLQLRMMLVMVLMMMMMMVMVAMMMMVMMMMMILMIIFPAGFLQQGTEHWWLPRLQPDQFNHIDEKISTMLRIRSLSLSHFWSRSS